MTIGVYRIYVAHAFASDAVLAKLAVTLDATPNFLYRLDRITQADLLAAADAEAGERAAIRVAMTQSHLMLVPTDAAAEADRLRPLELDLARHGFRRRIPVLGLAEQGMVEAYAPALGIDRIVARDAAELACAIQELAEEAAAERRQANVIELARPLKSQPKLVTGRVDVVPVAPVAPRGSETTGERALPYCKIVDALEQLRTSRSLEKAPM